MTERSEVYEAIDSERDYQEKVWGEVLSSAETPDETRPPGYRTLDEWALYIIGYADDLLKIAAHDDDPKVKLDCIRKIATLGVVAMEQHGAPKR